MAAEPTGKIIGVVETRANRGFGDAGFTAECRLRLLQADGVSERAEPEAQLALQLPVEMIRVITEFAGDFFQRVRRADLLGDSFKKRRRRL